jgi:large subunit ribosomal protein L35
MPKLKPHKGLLKRVRLTRHGKIIARGAGRRHLLSGKGRKRKRRLSRPGSLNIEPTRRLREMIRGR